MTAAFDPRNDDMMAARIHSYGDPDVIRYEPAPRPAPGPGEVLVRVAAAGFNPSDIGLRTGWMRDIMPADLPLILGFEAAGTVAETRDDRFAVGDRVVARLDKAGGAAEYVAVPATAPARVPATIPLSHAAALPIAGLTAWQGLFDHAGLRPGARILITGAGGGVGMFAVQLARHAGAHVIAAASPRSTARVRSYGPHEIIDYTRTSPLEASDGPVDLVFNLAPISADAAITLCHAIRPGGALISATVQVDPPPEAEVTTARFIVENNPAQLHELMTLIESGAVRVDVTSRSLADLQALHRDAESGRTTGKIILVP